MILSGTREAVLLSVQRIDIHGTIFYDITFHHTGETQPIRARIGAESVYPNPQPGDQVLVSYVVGVVTNITPRPS
jgi:tRNA-binding EMAP/Myf-like protein